MDIRILVPQDAEIYRKLRLEALRTHPEAYGSSAEEEGAMPSEAFEQRLAGGDALTFGAWENGELIGITTLVRESSMKMRHRCNIYAVYVSSAHRGKGIARLLMNAVIEQARAYEGTEQIYLTVVSANEPAKRLYQSLGFRTYGTDLRALKIGNTYVDEEMMVLQLQ
ncbi:GNAT family N-acetyltransferase [Paenibacillus sp. JX-17]|uniref:GNAT family N-acetyltransferase n=1 Tax=Paenibacillus lacisoli TaxID=3064525 RepID=A0ABT9CCG3_9BACL|nr:GNAT family N-acetyltransferase [Paenibacillus sp. JX-17]MDO7906950.1 GNAT family N-acetyltransferase [Paenibacillus sp. JX-17]